MYHTNIHVLETVNAAFPERLTVPAGMNDIQESGRLGRKNQKGFYKYENGKKAGPDNSIYQLVQKNGSQKSFKAAEIVDRCLLLFVNETARCLEEGILSSPYDGDAGAVFGLGFPPFLGGPFKYVDFMGAGKVVESLNALAAEHGKRFEPCELLKQHAASQKLFYPDELS